MLTPQQEAQLATLPDTLWSKGPTDVGLIKDHAPVQVGLVKTDRPKQRQYPISKEAVAGIQPVIEDMLKAGILRETLTPQCLTPIFPVRKANRKGWRMVQDLRAVNDIVKVEPVQVANPHTILNHISPRDKWFSVIDLSNAFFSVPLHEASQDLFAFRFNNKMYTYTRLPQGFTNSPTLYSQALKASMTKCPPLTDGQYLLYVDDILVTGGTKESCTANTLTVLQHLHQEGHKVSRLKMQFCRPQVTYLGHFISQDGKSLVPDRKLAILSTPRPETKQQMMSFLGLCNYCRTWIPEFSRTVQPLQNLIYGKQTNGSERQNHLDRGRRKGLP